MLIVEQEEHDEQEEQDKWEVEEQEEAYEEFEIWGGGNEGIGLRQSRRG